MAQTVHVVRDGAEGVGIVLGEDGTVSSYTGDHSAAEAAGVALGSRILAVNGRKADTKTVVAMLSDEALGESVELLIELPDTELVLRSHRAQPTAESAADPVKVKMVEGIGRLAHASFLSGSFEQALQAYSEALALTPHNCALLLSRAQCYIKVGQAASQATAETMYALATVDAELALQHMPDAVTAARAHATRAEALWMLKRHQEAEEALRLALALAPSDGAVLQAQMQMQHAPEAGAAPAPDSSSRKGGRLSKMLSRRGPSAAPEPETQHLPDGPTLHAVAPAQRPSDAVIEVQLRHVLDEMGFAPGSAEREAAKSLEIDQKWAMIEAAAAKRVVDQNAKAQEYAAAQAALAKRAGPGFIGRKKAALKGHSSVRDEGEQVGLITHWDGTSSVTHSVGQSKGSGSGSGGGASTGRNDTRWMCVEPDIAWRQVEFLKAENVTDASFDLDSADAPDDATSHYTIYRMRAHTVDGRKWEVAKRYSEFVAFRQELLEAGLAISHLSFPPKTTWSLAGRTSESLVARRLTQLQAWMTALIATYPDHVLIGVFLHADSDLAQLETLRMKWSQPERAMTYQPKGWSPLHTAAQRGDLAAIEDAIEEGFIAQCRGMASSDEEGDIPSSGTSGREPVVLDAVDCNGQTAMHRAAALGHADIVFALLGAGASPSVVSCCGYTALHISAREGFASIVSQLCIAIKQQAQTMQGGQPASADLDVPSQTGNTPLHYAAIAGDTNTVRVLLEQGASPHMTNMLADTPLDAMGRARDHGSLAQDEQDETTVASEDDTPFREIMQMLQQAMRERPAPPPRPPPRPPTKQEQQQQQQQQQQQDSPAQRVQALAVGRAVGVEDRSSVARARAAIERGAGGELRCVVRTTVRESPDLASRKVGSLPVGTTVTAQEAVELQLRASSLIRFRIGNFGETCGWVSLHSSKSGALLFEEVPAPMGRPAGERPEPANVYTASALVRPAWQYSRELSRISANGALWCSGTPEMRSAAAALHAFYQEHCLGGAGAAQLLASPRSAQGDDVEATNGGSESMTLYDDDSWLQDEQDSPLSTRSHDDSDGEGQSPETSNPTVHEALSVGADEVGRFAPAARSVFLQAVKADPGGGRGEQAYLDAATQALELYTQGLQVAMGVVRTAQKKEPMKKSLEPFFARAFSLRTEVAATKTATEAATEAMDKTKDDSAGAAASAVRPAARLSEGIPPPSVHMQPRPGALTLSPRSPGELPSPQPDDPGYHAFLTARQALRSTLQKSTPASPASPAS